MVIEKDSSSFCLFSECVENQWVEKMAKAYRVNEQVVTGHVQNSMPMFMGDIWQVKESYLGYSKA